MWLFSDLPEDIIRMILSYDTVLRYRNGKYMNQIAQSDPRNDMITQRILYPRNPIYYTVTTNKENLILFYRPYDIYWFIGVLPETVVYRYSLTMEKNAILHHRSYTYILD